MFIVIRSEGRKKDFDALLQHAEISISAHVTNTGQPPEQHENRVLDDVKYHLDTTTIAFDASMSEVYSSPDGSSSSAVLKAELHLRHPERQTYRPAVQVTSSMALISSYDDDNTHPTEDYMTSGVPLPENLLQGLQNSPAFAGVNVQLPANRIQKVVPRSKAIVPEARPVRGTSRQIAIVPAIAVKFARSAVGQHSLVSLEIEVIKWAKSGIVLEDVGGVRRHERLGPLQSMKLPQTMRVADKTTCIFRLENGVTDATSLHVNAKVLLSDDCSPHISVKRTIAPQPYLGQLSRVNLIRHWQRPTSQISRPTSLAVPDRGMTFSLSAPAQVSAGETFKLDILVVNKSVKKRRLAILAVTDSIKPNSNAKRHSKNPSRPALDGSIDVARAIVDDNALYGSQNGHFRQATQAELVSLTADAKVGPLAPGACHDIQLEFLALSSGVVGLEALTIVDLDSRETVHITELPDVVAVERQESQRPSV